MEKSALVERIQTAIDVEYSDAQALRDAKDALNQEISDLNTRLEKSGLETIDATLLDGFGAKLK